MLIHCAAYQQRLCVARFVHIYACHVYSNGCIYTNTWMGQPYFQSSIHTNVLSLLSYKCVLQYNAACEFSLDSFEGGTTLVFFSSFARRICVCYHCDVEALLCDVGSHVQDFSLGVVQFVSAQINFVFWSMRMWLCEIFVCDGELTGEKKINVRQNCMYISVKRA